MTTDEDLEQARFAFIRGDPRPLAKLVLTSNDLSSEARDFIAKALCGDVEKIDGRKVKPHTEKIERDFFEWQGRLWFANRMAEAFGIPPIRDSKIIEKLAGKYGYQDPDSLRRTVSRLKKKRKERPITQKRIVIKNSGHEKK